MFGCTAIVHDEGERGIVLARNMDWPSFGIAGAYSLVINRKASESALSTVEVGLPGLAGTLTGMNSRGLCVAMNVCAGETRTIQGMPAVFYNRACLESCKTVAESENFVDQTSPLGDYHLTVLDKSDTQSYHFYQGEEKQHYIRRFAGLPIITLNWRYSKVQSCDMHQSQERQDAIAKFFYRQKEKPLEDALALPLVNNWLTTHRVVMEPKSNVCRVAFDNAFAGKAPLHDVPLETLFA